jgi:hypothetical protein
MIDGRFSAIALAKAWWYIHQSKPSALKWQDMGRNTKPVGDNLTGDGLGKGNGGPSEL